LIKFNNLERINQQKRSCPTALMAVCYRGFYRNFYFAPSLIDFTAN